MLVWERVRVIAASRGSMTGSLSVLTSSGQQLPLDDCVQAVPGDPEVRVPLRCRGEKRRRGRRQGGAVRAHVRAQGIGQRRAGRGGRAATTTR